MLVRDILTNGGKLLHRLLRDPRAHDILYDSRLCTISSLVCNIV